jgi:2-O-methyltransferase
MNAIKKLVWRLKGEPPTLPGELDLGAILGLLGKNDPVILDIGCNDGSHTLEFLRLFGDSRVYAFEPDPRAIVSFRSKVRSDKAKLFEFAISDEDGNTQFHISDGIPSGEWARLRPGGWDLSSSIKKPKEHLAVHPWCTFDTKVVVRTRRLDTWCLEQGVGPIDFIWADVQGAEENLIRGGREALGRTRYFYTEYCDRELYEGQISLGGIRKLLPDFDMLYRFANNVLLKNMKLA